MKAKRTGNNPDKFSIVNEKSYAFNYLQNDSSVETLNLFGQTSTSIVGGNLNYDISNNIFYFNMDLSGTMNNNWDISFNLVINNLYI